jgi:hypothetical protein
LRHVDKPASDAMLARSLNPLARIFVGMLIRIASKAIYAP